MSRIYLRVIVSNDSHATLRLKRDWTSRSWTPRWLPSGHPLTGPGEDLSWQAEGDAAPLLNVPISGVEARAWYDVIDSSGAVVGELYIFANDPLVESAYGNTFEVRTPPGFYAAYSSAKGQSVGDHAILHISFRNTRKVSVPGFLPSKHGFQFRNHWSGNLPVLTLGTLWNQFRKGLVNDAAELLGIPAAAEDWVPITRASAGMCGGMTFATMDYFYANQLPPLAKTGPDMEKSKTPVPIPPDSADDPLFQFIRDRLLDSFDFTGRGHRWLSYTSPLYPNGDSGVSQALGVFKGRSWVTYREEWPRIREELDAGRLVTIGLVQSAEFDIGANHQVLAYAYEQSGQVVTLWIYDPNIPEQANRWEPDAGPSDPDQLRLEFDITSTTGAVSVHRHGYSSEKTIFAIIHMDSYSQRTPPPGRDTPTVRPKYFKLLEADARSHTTEGSGITVDHNICGEPYRTGHWTCFTEAVFATQTSGYDCPSFAWKINGVDVPPAPGPVAVPVTGRTIEVDARINPGGSSLSVTSRPGDTFRVEVSVEMRDATGEMLPGKQVFEVEGSYDGPNIEDIGAAARCFARNIPVPIDMYSIPKPNPGEELVIDLDEWRRETIERIRLDASLDEQSRTALKAYVVAQAKTPELRANAPIRVNRANLRVINR